MSIKENLINKTYDLDVIEIEVGIVDESIPFKDIKPFLKNFFMKEGYLVIKDDKTKNEAKSYFKASPDELSLTIYVTKDVFIYNKLNLNTFETEIELGELNRIAKFNYLETILKFKNDAVEYADATLSHLCYANYLAHTQREVIIENTIMERKTLHGKKKAKKKVKTIRKIKLTNEVRRVYAHKSDGEKRTYERHTESWTVRGHYRHYKSGKVVWIPASTRGSGKVQNKVYTIGG